MNIYLKTSIIVFERYGDDMNINDVLNQIDDYNNQINVLNSITSEEEQEIYQTQSQCIEDYNNLSNSNSINQVTTSNGATNNYVLRDSNGNAIQSSNIYQDGTTLEYNNVIYTYKSEYGAFVKTDEKLCTSYNIASYMLPKPILESIHANVIVEFKPSQKVDEAMDKYFSPDYQNKKYLGTSENHEMPISRIYNIDHGYNNVYFELNQYWAGQNIALGSKIGTNKQTTQVNGCLVFSMINGYNYKAQDTYDSNTVSKEIEKNVTNVLQQFNVNSSSNDETQRINSYKNIEIYAQNSQMMVIDETLEKQQLNMIKEDGTYIIRTDNKNNTGKIKSTGGHYITMIPSGINGHCYIIDSNNSLIKSGNKYIPYMSYDDAKKSIVENKNIGTSVVATKVTYF